MQLANWRHEDQDATWCFDKARQAACASRQWSNHWLSNELVNFAKMLHTVFDVSSQGHPADWHALAMGLQTAMAGRCLVVLRF